MLAWLVRAALTQRVLVLACAALLVLLGGARVDRCAA